MNLVVLGGGCYGEFYTRQALRASDAGRLALEKVIVVDRDEGCRARQFAGDPRVACVAEEWDAFLARYLRDLPRGSDDRLVPPPFTPHLALRWLLNTLAEDLPDRAWSTEPSALLPDLPFRRQSEGGPLVLSHADWICPVNCIEPDTCPRTRGPRSWDMSESVRALARSLADAGQPVEQVHLFQCHHLVYGIGAYPAAGLPAARDAIRSAARRARRTRFLVGTVSRCHGAVHILVSEGGMERVSPPEIAFSVSSP